MQCREAGRRGLVECVKGLLFQSVECVAPLESVHFSERVHVLWQ